MSSSLIRRIARFARLPPSQRRIFLHALALLPAVEARLRLGGLESVRGALERLPPPSAARPSEANAHTIARLVAAAARHGPLRADCLATSLALQWLLRKYGLSSDLRIGVRRAGARMEAHAWVEHEGVSLLDGPGVHERYGAFDPIPHRRGGAG